MRVPLSEFMEFMLDQVRSQLWHELAANFAERCPVCEARSFVADGAAVPQRDEDNVQDSTDDFIEEVLWFVCMTCGAVFDTYELTIEHGERSASGKLVQVTDTPSFIDAIHKSVGYKR